MTVNIQPPPLDPFDPGVRGVDVPVALAPAPLVPNKSDIAKHLYALFSPSFVQAYPDAWIEIAFGHPGRLEGAVDAAETFSVFDLEKAVAFAEQKNAAGFNLYVGPAIRQGERPKTGRASDTDAVTSAYAWSEFDGDGDDVRIAGVLKEKNIAQAIMVITGHTPNLRAHLYFRLAGAVTRDQLLGANTALVGLLGGDSVQAPAHVMRLAGTINWPTAKKKGRGYIPELVTLHTNPSARAYTAEELIGSTGGDKSPWDEFIDSASKPAKTDDELTALLKASQVKEWHNNMRNAVAVMIGREWNDLQIRLSCAPYCTGGADDTDLEKLIDTGRKKFGKPDVEDNGHGSADPSPTAQQKSIHATPYAWTDPASIPPRPWLYGKLLLRKIVSATISPGAVGKSSLITAEALAMVSGKDLLGVQPGAPLRVWLWNKDPQEETMRKIQAAAIYYELGPDDIGDRLMVDSGRDQKLVIATATRNGAVIVQPVVDSLVAEIIKHKIDVLVIDPFVSCHEVAENDNGAMDMVVKEWGRVAERGNCAVHLVHHTRKPKGTEEVSTDSSRGASSQTDACRVVRPINRMTKDQAANIGVENPWLYFRTSNDKPNLEPPVERSDWYRLVSVDLGNGPMGGDSVGVVTKWEFPEALAGVTAADFVKVAMVIRGGKWRESAQAKDWVGKAVAQALGLPDPVAGSPTKGKIKRMLGVWYAAKSLVAVQGFDDKRNSRLFVEVAEESA
jgi:hypothetical protein